MWQAEQQVWPLCLRIAAPEMQPMMAGAGSNAARMLAKAGVTANCVHMHHALGWKRVRLTGVLSCDVACCTANVDRLLAQSRLRT